MKYITVNGKTSVFSLVVRLLDSAVYVYMIVQTNISKIIIVSLTLGNALFIVNLLLEKVLGSGALDVI